MKLFITSILFLASFASDAQFIADGFFVQDHLYIDPVLLKQNKIDSFKIVYSPEHHIVYSLDSAGRVFKLNFYSQKGAREYFYSGNGLDRNTCYDNLSEEVKCNSMHKIESISRKKFRLKNYYDAYGRLQRSTTSNRGTSTSKNYTFNIDGSLKTVVEMLGDMRTEFEYIYIDKKLTQIRISKTDFNLDLSPGHNQANFEYYDFGLIKSRGGKMYNLMINLSCEFIYYSAGKIKR